MSFENVVGSLPDGPARDQLARVLANTPTGDQVFANSIAAAPVALGMTLVATGGVGRSPPKAGLAMAGDDPTPFLVSFPAVVAPIAILADAARGLGATNWLPDHDQIVRRVPLFVAGPSGPTPSLALEALRLAQGETTYVIKSSNASGESALGQQTGVNAIAVGSMEIATGANADVRPRYSHSNAARVIPAAKLLQDRVDRSEIDGRIIFVGTWRRASATCARRRWTLRRRAWKSTRNSSSPFSPDISCRGRTGPRDRNSSSLSCCSRSS